MIRWCTSMGCSHANNEVCRSCDFDLYYARHYADCPWATDEVEE